VAEEASGKKVVGVGSLLKFRAMDGLDLGI